MVDQLRSFGRLLVLSVGLIGAANAGAHQSTLDAAVESRECQAHLRPITVATVRDRAVQRNQAFRQVTPAVNFFDLAGQSRFEHPAETRTPLAFAQMTGRDVGAVALPTPSSPDEISVSLLEERHSFVVHVKTEWANRVRTTAVYVTLPGAKIQSAGDYLIGPENKAVVAFLHGGGTPSASGKNGVNIGEKMAPHGFATVSFDLFGHGVATKDLHGLEDTEKQMNFILKVMNQLIHPAVRRVGVGHSWGAQLYTYAWHHSDQPKFGKFDHFFILAPPVDASNCGDLKIKAAYETEWNRTRPEFEHRIAPTDVDFMNNLLKHGKDSEIGRIFCSATDRLYATPRVSLERQSQLKPVTVINGLGDGPVFVGKEGPQREAFGNLAAPSAYLELGPGPTFDGIRPTGHNPFDLLDANGRFLVYGLITDKLREITGYEPIHLPEQTPNLIRGVHQNFPDLVNARQSDVAPAGVKKRLNLLREYVRDYDRISKLEKKERKEVEAPYARAYAELMNLETVARAYWNFVGFRTILGDDVRFVKTSSADVPELSARKKALDTYQRDMAKTRETHVGIRRDNVKAAIDRLAVRLGLPPNFDVARANEELSYPELTDERRALLKNVTDQAEVVRTEEGDRSADPEYRRDLEVMSARYADTLNALNIRVDQYETVRGTFGKSRDLTREQNQRRIDLDNLHREFLVAIKARELRATAKRAQLLAPVCLKAGVPDARAARRQLDADRSPERRRALENFLTQVPAVTREAEAVTEVTLAEELAKVKKPEGLVDEDDIKALKAQHDDLMRLAYAPPGAGLDDLVAEINETQLTRDVALKGRGDERHVEVVTKDVEVLRQERLDAIGAWTLLWNADAFGSARVDAAAKRLLELDVTYRAAYDAWTNLAAARDLELQLANAWNMETVLDLPPDLRAAFAAYLDAKDEYLSQRDALERVRIAEAQAGNLQPHAGLSDEAVHIATRTALDAVTMARQIWGPHPVLNPSVFDESMTARLLQAERALEERRRIASAADQKYEDLRHRYVERMQELGYKVPNDLLRVRMADLFNQRLGLDDLLTRMDQEPRLSLALDQMLIEWDALMKLLRTEHNHTKDVGGGY